MEPFTQKGSSMALWNNFTFKSVGVIGTEMKLIFGDGREGTTFKFTNQMLPNTHETTTVKTSYKYGHQEQPRNYKRRLLGANLTFNYFFCIRGIWQVEVCEGTQARSEGMLLMLKSDHFSPRISTSHSHWNTTQHSHEMKLDQIPVKKKTEEKHCSIHKTWKK